MNCKETNRLLDGDPKIVDDWSSLDWASIDAHAADCSDCRRSVAAARLAHTLVVARTEHRIEPSIYFASRVAALARETAAMTGSSFISMWRAARFVVSSIVLLIIALLVLNYGQRPAAPVGGDGETSAVNQYSLERVIEDDGGQQSLTNAQVLDSLFGYEDNYGVN